MQNGKMKTKLQLQGFELATSWLKSKSLTIGLASHVDN